MRGKIFVLGIVEITILQVGNINNKLEKVVVEFIALVKTLLKLFACHC